MQGAPLMRSCADADTSVPALYSGASSTRTFPWMMSDVSTLASCSGKRSTQASKSFSRQRLCCGSCKNLLSHVAQTEAPCTWGKCDSACTACGILKRLKSIFDQLQAELACDCRPTPAPAELSPAAIKRKPAQQPHGKVTHLVNDSDN